MIGQIDGILFDLGDTLLDFGRVQVTRLFQAGGKLAYQSLREDALDLPPFGTYVRRQLRAIRWHYLLSRITGREFHAVDLILRLDRKMGHAISRERGTELAWLWYEPLSRIATVEDDLVASLRAWREAGLTLGIISNTFIPGEVLDRHLGQAGLLDLLPLRVYSCDVGIRKPNPEIFRIALERAGLEASRVLFVGDKPRADIKGAHRAGLVSVLKDPHGRHGQSRIRPAHRIRRVSDLTGILAGYGVQ